MTGLVVLGVAVAVVVALGAVSYNRFVGQHAGIESTWAGIDVQLQRRHDLVPELVEVVRGYAAHEQGVFERVTAARHAAVAADADQARTPADMVATEQELSTATRHLLALAEDHPRLHAARTFLDLQAQLVETEDRIAAARRLYNIEVQAYNRRCEAIPSTVVARLFGFVPADYFELTTLAARPTPSSSGS